MASERMKNSDTPPSDIRQATQEADKRAFAAAENDLRAGRDRFYPWEEVKKELHQDQNDSQRRR